ncbi:MAG: hypothetical protein ACTS1Z_14650 [Parasphingopyxis sp.]|uniref:hypothetical protein n=1 Tax=Parasphingopyxis sp. TaxID=1920299 RepID=UPI003F9ED74C
MELLLSRSQKSGLGGVKFILDVRSKLTSQEEEYVQKYKLGKTVIYEKQSVADAMASSGAFKQLAVAVAARSTGRMFTVNDLVSGRRVECKDIIEMLEAEEQIKAAAGVFHTVLMTCQTFGGEEVVTFPRDE